MHRLESLFARAEAIVAWLDGSTAALPAHASARAAGLAVAQLLAGWGADELLRAAGLLHRLVCIQALTPAQVGAAVHPQVAQLCEDFACLAALDVEPSLQLHSKDAGLFARPEQWRGKRLAYRRIRAYCAAYKDADLAFLQAAVLWNRLGQAQQGELAAAPYLDEASQLLGPYLEMLGMRQLRGELFDWLAQQTGPVAEIEPEQTAMVAAMVRHLAGYLPDAQLSTTNTQTHNFDAYNTAFVTQRTAAVPTIDIVVGDEAACYQALYSVHRLFMPVEDALADDIGAGRVNGYRSIATGVMAPIELPAMPLDTPAQLIKEASREHARRARVNVRIASTAMDEANRWGLAAFVLRNRLPAPPSGGWWQQAEEGYAQITSAPLGTLPEILYVFSPHGQLFRFPRGCTVVDYAYSVHSELADRCSRFYVNGESVDPTTVLHHLDLVELEHDPLAPGPTQVWLDAAQTSRARSKIERHLKRTGQGVYQGQRIVEQRRRALEEYFGFTMPEQRVNNAITHAMRRLKLTRVEELYGEIAAGRWAVDRMLHYYFAGEIIRQIALPRGLRLRPNQLQMAQCCLPRPGDDIVGRPLRRHGVIAGLKIHRRACEKLVDLQEEGDEQIPLKWRLQPQRNALARIEMSALNDDGLLGDAVGQIYAQLPRVQLHKVEAAARQGIAHLRFTVEADSMEVIETIVQALRSLSKRTIDRVQTMSLPPSEQEELLTRQLMPTVNPYSRLPVHEREMFFGRALDLERVVDWLQAGVGSIWLRGQKRVGKTSLLLHLRRYQLEEQGFFPIFVDFQLLSGIDARTIYFELANAVHSELQLDAARAETRLGEVGAPLRELFEHDPRGQFIAFLRGLQRRLGARRLVLLLDEFSRTIDALNQGRLDDTFFQQWRGVMLATMPGISYVTVIQQKSYDMLSAQRAQEDIDPVWELLELGEQLALRPLDGEDVRRLIEWPIRNLLEYTPETVEYVARLTGGSPFFIQAFCFKLVGHMTRLDRRQVTWEDVEVVRAEFMQPNESLFSHLLDLIHGIGHTIAQSLAQLADERADGEVSLSELLAALPQIEQAVVERTLQELAGRDVLVQTRPGCWRFANLLFAQWLTVNVSG